MSSRPHSVASFARADIQARTYLLPLVQKEFVLLRKQLLQIAVIVILIGFIGRIDPGMGFAYLAVFPGPCLRCRFRNSAFRRRSELTRWHF